MFSEIKYFHQKHRLFAKELSDGNLVHFPYCNSILKGHSTVPHKRFSERLELLRKKFQAHFQDTEEYYSNI
jgi:hypothetical protein